MQRTDPILRSCPRNSRSYAWQAGDSLLTVAAANGITPGALAAANPDIDFDYIGPGALICVPLGSASGGPVLDGTANDTGVVTPGFDGPVLDGTGSDTGAVTPGFDGPVLDGTGNDTGVVTPQRPITVLPGNTTIVIQPGVQPGLACPVGYQAYTVRRGQTYADLLVDLNVSYDALRAASPRLDPAYLVAGTRFCAPPAGSRQVCSRGSYRVQAGETLATLARRFGVTQGRLLMLNPSLLPTDFTQGAVICVP